MNHQKALVQHPMFLALVASMMLEHFIDRDLRRKDLSIQAVENRTQYHGWKHTQAGVAKRDYASLSAKMSGCNATLAGVERISKVIYEILEYISAYPTQNKSQRIVGHTTGKIEECVEILHKRLRMQEFQIRFLSRRAEIQLTAIIPIWRFLTSFPATVDSPSEASSDEELPGSSTS